MNCLFVHDFRSYTYKGVSYSTNLSYEILKKRYLSHFDELRMLNRTKIIDNNLNGKYVVSNGEGVVFLNKIDMFSSVDFFVKLRKYRKVVYDEVHKADFVIIRLDSFLGLIAAEYCEKLHKKYIIEVAGCVWDSFWNKGVSGKMLAPFLYFLTRKRIKNSKYAIYVTTNFLQNRYPNQFKNIACSNVDLPMVDYNEVLFKRIEHIKSKSKDERVVISTVAAVDVAYKNQETVIRALGYLKRNGNSNFTYNLIGAGNTDRLKSIAISEKVVDQISFHGSVSHDIINQILDYTDIYIQPSKQEGLPRALIEAMSRGCYCLGSNVAGIPELLDNECVFDVKSSSDKLAYMIKKYNDVSALQMAERNIKEAKKYLSETLENRRFEFIEEAIKNDE